MDDRRSSYRVRDGLEQIRVSISWPGQEPMAARLVDLSAHGASVQLAVPAAQRTAVPVGTSVHVSFEIPGIAPLEDVLSHVRHIEEKEREELIGLEIDDLSRLQNALPRRLFALFNQRRDFRVEVPQQPPIEVEITRGDAARTSARLLDISAGGCGLLFATDGAPHVDDALTLRFQLPGAHHSYDLIGLVKAVRALAKGARCGVEFDHKDAKQLALHQQRIRQYVMQRQREDLRNK